MQRSAPFSHTVATLLACAWMALVCAIPFSGAALAQDHVQAIRSLIGKTWDKPDSKVETSPVVVSGHFAVASWTQGARGGRALLRQDKKGWSVALCSGDPVKDAGWLVEAGVPRADADRIAKDLAAAEALVPAERRAMFSLFEGVVSGGSDHRGPSGHDRHSH